MKIEKEIEGKLKASWEFSWSILIYKPTEMHFAMKSFISRRFFCW